MKTSFIKIFAVIALFVCAFAGSESVKAQVQPEAKQARIIDRFYLCPMCDYEYYISKKEGDQACPRCGYSPMIWCEIHQ